MIKFHRAKHQNQSAYKTEVSDRDLYFNKILAISTSWYVYVISMLAYLSQNNQAALQAAAILCGLFCLVTNKWKPGHQQISGIFKGCGGGNGLQSKFFRVTE